VTLRAGKEAAYTSMSAILDDLRGAFDATNPNNEAARRLDWWKSLPLLCIDEFNRVNGTPWVQQRQFDLMDARYVQGIRGETLTLIASNTGPDQQEGALADRIKDNRFTIIHLSGDSGRQWIGKEFKF
jgi:DNA replication protein DnaC